MYNPATLSDQQLVLDYQAGNERSFEELLKRHKNKLLLFIRSKIKNHDEVNDVFSEFWFKVVRAIKRGQYAPTAKFENWLLFVAHNCVIDHCRKEKARRMVKSDEAQVVLNSLPDSTVNREENFIQDERCTQLRSLLRKLPRPQQKFLLLYFYSGKSGKEISELLHISRNTLNHRFRYAMQHLKMVAMSSSTTIGYE